MNRRGFISIVGAAVTLRSRATWKLLSSETVRALIGGASGFALIGSARAQAVSVEELKNPGPLPDMVLGSSDGPITIIEYASLTCPHCAQFAVTTFLELKARYIETGKVRYIFREYPIGELAFAASMLARSVSNDRYFSAIETLFRQQRQWAVDRIQPLMTLATRELGFTEQGFKAALKNQELLDGIKGVRDRASKVFGVDSTPTFFINGTKVKSYQTMKQMEQLIDPLLKG